MLSLVAKNELKLATRGLFGEKTLFFRANPRALHFHLDTNLPNNTYKISKVGQRIRISAKQEIEILYGVFDLLRRIQSGENIENINPTMLVTIILFLSLNYP